MPRTNTKNIDLSMMSFIPMQSAWLTQLPAFQSNDASLVRGCLKMLMAAFHGQPAGTIPDTVEALATATGMSVDAVRKHYATLTGGWKKSKTKEQLVFLPLYEMAARLHDEHKDALRRLQDATVLAIQAPDLFNSELLPQQGSALANNVGSAVSRQVEALADTKIRRTLPDGARLPPGLSEFLLNQGFSLPLHEEIWEYFSDFHRSRQTKSASWKGEFRSWVMNQIRYGKLKPCSGKKPSIFQQAMSEEEGASTMKPKPRFSFMPTISPSRFSTMSKGDALEAQAMQKISAANAVISARKAQASHPYAR